MKTAPGVWKSAAVPRRGTGGRQGWAGGALCSLTPPSRPADESSLMARMWHLARGKAEKRRPAGLTEATPAGRILSPTLPPGPGGAL
jgi:hypothetical protein